METKRSEAYGSLKTELQSLRTSTVSLQEQSTALATALRGSSQTRGVIGEMILRNIVEVAGMTKHCDFLEQKKTAGGGKPDIVVKLPGGGRIPIDAKFPLAAFQDAIGVGGRDRHAVRDPAARSWPARQRRQSPEELTERQVAFHVSQQVALAIHSTL